MKDTTKGFTTGRIEEVARTADVISRAGKARNGAVSQSADRLGTPGVGAGQALGGKTIV